jgi:hypothetical protein
MFSILPAMHTNSCIQLFVCNLEMQIFLCYKVSSGLLTIRSRSEGKSNKMFKFFPSIGKMFKLDDDGNIDREE